MEVDAVMILIAYGTRPEIIKLFPLVRQLQKNNVPFKTLFTGQQTDLYDDLKGLLPPPDYSFADYFSGYGKHNTLTKSFIKICSAAERLFTSRKFRIVVVQGDTTTAWAISLAAFYNGVKVAHVEAGLRTFDLRNPFPEEANRSLIEKIAAINFAPTARAKENLEKEGARNVYLVGNTVVDAVNFIKNEYGLSENSASDTVIVTLHRRENLSIMDRLFDELNKVANEYPWLTLILPIHPNPGVRKHRDQLNAANIKVIEPVGYLEMLSLIASSAFIITDSGGLQEEAACFNKKVLIVRKVTERPEIIDIGLGRLVGSAISKHIDWALSASLEEINSFPFGDGHAAEKIVRVLAENK